MPTKGNHGVKFVYYANTKVWRVSVAGTFNGWNYLRGDMQNIGGKAWELELSLPKGRHLYKIVINEEEWIVDPLNPNISEDGQNNSAFTVTEDGEVLIRTTDISAQRPNYIYQNFTAVQSPEWIQKSVIYELHLRAFGKHGFKGLMEKLEYLQELGVNTLWMMPFQQVGKQKRQGTYGDPYAVQDYYSIDASFGTAEDLRALIGKAHGMGMRMIMDWVMNRGSVDHVWTGSHPEYFTRNGQGEVYYEVPNRDYFAGLNFDNSEMRKSVIDAMTHWAADFDFDGFRLDDSDITPVDFLEESRHALSRIKKDIVLISQSYDEYHHMVACDLTYDGSLRLLIQDMAENKVSQSDFARVYHSYKYSFPKGALRMRWLEEKEQTIIREIFGEHLSKAAASVLLTMDGVPMIMMGQEFNERSLHTWTSLFEEYQLDWSHFDQELFEHYRFPIELRTRSAAFWNGELEFIAASEDKVLSYVRSSETEQFLVIVSFSENPLLARLDIEPEIRNPFLVHGELIYRTGKGTHSISEDGDGISLDPFETQIYRLEPHH
ncbi:MULTISPECIES: alpha-amylase family glycosyl hydrolase [Paenibacillus]|uniref:alpha-amylase family glycosyl hydrolase n=1 Tax=Paenibacillus TaxID=44249 RepID=UPI0022B8F8C2|nr:alpha-amylase family glycosyl hydrolase [Paenibacillus caseinilyticus]MCZ8521320.1 alpha-amylase family glycosyl hydrolase [Paenibacillus caseinilyticus]